MVMNTRRIIILGASGFIGKNLFDKFSAGKNTTRGFSSKELDLLSAKELRGKLADVTPRDVLIVAAAITRLRENNFDSMAENIRMMENLAEFMMKHPVGHVIYLSTIDVYGVDIAKGARITEKTELRPNDYYAISKLAGEFLLRRACRHVKIPLTILRLCGIYGPGDGNKSMIGNVVLRALHEKKIIIYGNGKDLRDYVHINDLYALIHQAIDRKLNMLLNVATGQSYPIVAIARIIKSLLPMKIALEFKAGPKRNAGSRVRDLRFDCACLKQKFLGIELLDIKSGIAVYLKEILKQTDEYKNHTTAICGHDA